MGDEPHDSENVTLDEQKRLRVWVYSKPVIGVALITLALITVSALALLFPPALAVSLVGGLFVWLLATIFNALTHVTVGRDGILIQRRLSKRFIPFSQVRQLTNVDDKGVRFELESGELVDLMTYHEENSGQLGYVEKVESLRARINEGLAAARASTAERQPRLANSTEEGRGYRSASINEEELLQRLQSPQASPEERVRIAASVAKSPERRLRIRAAAENTANPKVRRLLRVAADDELEEAELEQQLRDLRVD